VALKTKSPGKRLSFRSFTHALLCGQKSCALLHANYLARIRRRQVAASCESWRVPKWCCCIAQEPSELLLELRVAQEREGRWKEAGVCRLLNDSFMESTEQAAKPARHRIEIKLSEHEKALIVQGAELAGKGVSAFVRDAAERAARELISERQPKRR
jgi:hypothetical protein